MGWDFQVSEDCRLAALFATARVVRGAGAGAALEKRWQTSQRVSRVVLKKDAGG